MTDTSAETGAPAAFDDILADFELLDDWEDRYRYVIELGRKLDPLPDDERTQENKVQGCASQVWLATHANGAGNERPRLIFHGDSAALLDATSGPDEGDPYHCPLPERPFAAEVGADPGQLAIAFSTRTLSGVEAHPDCVRAVEETAALCSELGHRVVEGSPDVDGDLFSDTFLTQFSCGVGSVVDSIVQGSQAAGINLTADDFEPLTWRVKEIGAVQSASTYLRAISTIQQIGRDMARFHADNDLWLTPTLSRPPVHPNHPHLQRHRPAGHERAAALERRGSPDRHSFHRPLWRGGHSFSPRRAARRGAPLGDAPSTRTCMTIRMKGELATCA